MKQLTLPGMENNTDTADQIGREEFPELNEVMDIRNILMEAAENINGVRHEGSGAGLRAADFRFFLNGKYYMVEVTETGEAG